VGVLRVLVRPEATKIGVGVAINIEVIGRIKNETFINDAFEISTDALEST
jgi:hypothetical protein